MGVPMSTITTTSLSVERVKPRTRSGACRRSYRRKKKMLRIMHGDNYHKVMEFVLAGRKHSVSVEHLIPLSEGGNNDYDNLRLVHRKCNR